jgi:hypothetical protein
MRPFSHTSNPAADPAKTISGAKKIKIDFQTTDGPGVFPRAS